MRLLIQAWPSFQLSTANGAQPLLCNAIKNISLVIEGTPTHKLLHGREQEQRNSRY